jgi:uncharacterized membrane protein
MTAPRCRALDLARGLAVVAMIVFHTIWDLSHFGYIAANIPWSPAMRLFGHAIAFAFLFIAGVSLVLANADGVDVRLFGRRLARVVAAAALVTLGTWLVFPGAYVYFGILHCIAAASVAGLMFLRAPWPLTLAAAAFCFAAPALLTSSTFNAPALFWLGLGTRETLTQDWRPFFPWAGALLLGVAAARAPLSLRERVTPQASGEGSREGPEAQKPLTPAQSADSLPMGEGVAFLGRHSLSIYLIHQPLLFALFSALAFIAPEAPEASAFAGLCERRCVANGESKALCHELCACTAEEASRSPLPGDEDERRRRLGAITRLCRGRLQ